jgi:hypothetical protein
MADPKSRAGGANRRSKGGRTTPKATPVSTSGRYTPPIPRSQKVSPRWVPILMFTLLIAGALVILLNYLGLLGHASNGKLFIGLGLIAAGFVTATNYH